jgi:hypothetical protein
MEFFNSGNFDQVSLAALPTKGEINMKKMWFWPLGFALFLTSLTLAGCGHSRSGGGDTPPLSLQSVEKYPVSGVLKETDGYAMPGTVQVSATDSLGNAVKLFSDKTGGTEVSSIPVAADGMVAFFVDGNAALPVTVKAWGSSHIPNHLGNSAKFTVDSTGTSYFAINIVDMDVPSAGILPHVEDGSLDLDDQLITTFDMIEPSAEVIIPTGTKFLNGSGIPLTGTVKAALTQFTSSNTANPIIDETVFDTSIYDPELEGGTEATLVQSDLENFPGGLNNTHATAGTGYFVTAGFVAVDVIDADGNIAKEIAPGDTFTIRMNIAADTLDPTTQDDRLLAAGDMVPVFTYDETTLLWKPELDGSGNPVEELVQLDPVTGGLYVLHTTDHFSFWDLGWLVTTTTASCTATMNLQNDAIAFPLTLKATFSGKNGKKGKNFLLTGFKPAGESTITALNVPNANLNIVLTNAQNKVVWSQKNVNWCAAPLTASYTAPVSRKAVPVTVNVSEYCVQDPSVFQVVPSTLTTVTKAVNNAGKQPPVAYIPISYGITDINGSYVHNVVPGSYDFAAYDRRTATYVQATNPINPVTVVKKTAPSVAIEIPVTCTPTNTGSTGSTGGYNF